MAILKGDLMPESFPEMSLLGCHLPDVAMGRDCPTSFLQPLEASLRWWQELGEYSGHLLAFVLHQCLCGGGGYSSRSGDSPTGSCWYRHFNLSAWLSGRYAAGSHPLTLGGDSVNLSLTISQWSCHPPHGKKIIWAGAERDEECPWM